MFGYITANLGELTQEQKDRYGSVYCGICRNIGSDCSHLARLGLRYDMAFLALLLQSLYEPQERQGKNRCLPHPLLPRPWTDSPVIRYTAQMNVALAYQKCLDDWKDDHSTPARMLAKALKGDYGRIRDSYPRQCAVLERCLGELNRLEEEHCQNPDLPAGLFGQLMAELFVWQEDLWEEDLRQLGMALGRFIYLMDAVLDAPEDEKKGSYNPTLGLTVDWEQIFSLTMARCTDAYERLPLVQDKALLDNILYSGVWVPYRQKYRKEGGSDHGTL